MNWQRLSTLITTGELPEATHLFPTCRAIQPISRHCHCSQAASSYYDQSLSLLTLPLLSVLMDVKLYILQAMASSVSLSSDTEHCRYLRISSRIAKLTVTDSESHMACMHDAGDGGHTSHISRVQVEHVMQTAEAMNACIVIAQLAIDLNCHGVDQCV